MKKTHRRRETKNRNSKKGDTHAYAIPYEHRRTTTMTTEKKQKQTGLPKAN